MKSVILYAHPVQPDGLSIQGHYLYKGMLENGEQVEPCHLSSEFEKKWLYTYFKPDVAIGIGYWNYTPDIIHDPLQYGVQPVPWLVADGWGANYQKDLSALPLVLTTSTWVKETYARDGVDTKNFEVMPIGFDPKVHRPVPRTDTRVQAIRKMLGIEDDEIMIFTMGGDVTSKGAQEILKALKKVDQEFKKWKYVCKVWGGDSADDHYEAEMKLIEDLGDSQNKVQYLEGSFSHEFTPYLLSACDIYAAPSRLEGFGMIQMEAQACGVPVISIDYMGPRETVVHGETGFLAKVGETVDLTEEWAYQGMGFKEDHKIKFEKPKTFGYRADIDELAQYLLRLMKDPDLRATMGKKATANAVQKFEYHIIAKRTAELIKQRLKLK